MVDLFAGDLTASAAMRKRGWDVVSVDLLWGDDVMKWKWDRRPVDLLWASPPCEKFSVAGHFKHFRYFGDRAFPIDDEGQYALRLVERAFQIRRQMRPKFFVLENPRGLLRKLIGPPTATTWYCQFGDERAKPTDLWMIPQDGPDGFLPLPTCRNRATDHATAPRGAKTGTQGRKGIARAAVPYDLSERLCLAVERHA